jgi:hypothetical protein
MRLLAESRICTKDLGEAIAHWIISCIEGGEALRYSSRQVILVIRKCYTKYCCPNMFYCPAQLFWCFHV